MTTRSSSPCPSKPTYEELEAQLRTLQREAAAYQDLKQTLESNKHQLAEIISGSPIPTFVIDNDHVVTHFNKACENLTGILASDIIGTTKQWKAFYKEKRPVMADFILDSASETKVAEYYYGKYKRSGVALGAYEAEDFFPDLGLNGKWLFFTAAPLKDNTGNIIGAIETLQDITLEKITTMQSKALLRISMALHEYTELEPLLDYISSEVKYLLGTEGALVILLDEETQELYFKGSAYDDPVTGKRVKEARFSIDQLAAGKVIKTGQPLIVHKTSAEHTYPIRDQRMGYHINNLIEVPIQTGNRIIGVLNANNKIEGHFGQPDIDLLHMIAGTVDLAIENARITDALKEAYKEVSSLNIAKTKVINHLSHELKTPLAALTGAVGMIEDELKPVPEEDWRPLLDIAHRNMSRIVAIQEEVTDIMDQKSYKSHDMVTHLFEQCRDLLALIVAQKLDQGKLTEKIKSHLDAIYLADETTSRKIDLKSFLSARLELANEYIVKRNIDLNCYVDSPLMVDMPETVLAKIIDGLIRNAVENTPNEGRIDVTANSQGKKIQLEVHDFGVGIAEAYQVRIFEGFFPTQGLTQYATKKPFDFNAGGKGADLLRLKIFSEKFNFTIAMESIFCPQIEATQGGKCPGSIANCTACQQPSDCHQNGGTTFRLHFFKA